MTLFGLVCIWLLTSIILQKSPTEVLSNAFSKLPNPTSEAKNKVIAQKDMTIDSLQQALNDCQASSGFTKALVVIDGTTLNMRDEASLTSQIVMKIPSDSEVDIMFYDTETYYLNGEAGKWCRIRYAGKEGWVWGNFLREI